jgi:hypothetical protein
MIYHSQEFSDFERCAKLPQIKKKWEPDRWPVREAVKQKFYSSLLRDPEEVADEFLYEAGARGYEYPEGEPYELAKDYASWLDGALRLVREDTMLSPISNYFWGTTQFELVGYVSGQVNIVRIVHELGDHHLRWPEIIALGLGDSEVVIHQYKLPSVRKRRLASPLSLAYQQPMTGGYRLAKRDGETISFGPNWKRLGRWEIPEVPWQEWREGIDRDRCLPAIKETYSVTPFEDSDKRRLLNDIEHIMASMSKVTHPRKWEACETCIFKPVCHGNKHGFHRKTMQRAVRKREADLVLQ